jgi:hypothetical protein
MTVDNILKASGETVKGENGGSIKVVDVSKDEDTGVVKLRVQLDYPQDVQPGGVGGIGGGFINPGGPVQILPVPAPNPVPVPRGGPLPPQQGQNFQVQVQVGAAQAVPARIVRPGFNGAEGLTIVDEKGNTLQPTITGINIQAGPGGFVRDITMEVKVAKDAPAPAKLVFSGTRMATLDIPFTLKDVPLKK